MPSGSSYSIAVLPGDGIGREVVPEGIRALRAVSDQFGLQFHYHSFDWSCDEYKRTGSMMPVDGLKQLRDNDAILFGAVGALGVPDNVSVWGLLLPIRREFDQYVNLRPVRPMPHIPSPLLGKKGNDLRLWVVRENTEGEYSRVGGRSYAGTDRELVTQQSVFSRHGVDRILRYAFKLAQQKGVRHVTSATKSNGLFYTMPYWDERFQSVRAEYPGITADQFHIDILSAKLVTNPEHFDVIVASNLFGDILSELSAAIAGTLGVAPSANINPEGQYPSLFEPIHGSAPDIAGRGIANPIGAIQSVAMMLEHFGETEASNLVTHAVDQVLTDPSAPLTPDMGGSGTTTAIGSAVAAKIAAA